jgi:hypothetical protein
VADGSPSHLTHALRFRQVANLVNLSTPLGLGVAVLGRCHIRRGPRGLVLADHYRFGFPTASAFTVGNVLITPGDWTALARQRPTLMPHEERHTWQWVALAGLPLLPAYGLAMAWSVLRTGDRAARNVFETRAGLVLGGYREVAPRPLGRALLAAASSHRAHRRHRTGTVRA